MFASALFRFRTLPRRLRAGLLGAALIAGTASLVYAQIEGDDRGIQPVNSSKDIVVTGIHVDVTADSPDAARAKGWREAQRLAWTQLAKKNGAPAGLSDAALDAMVSSVIVDHEEVSGTRYIAQLGIAFDRGRSGQLLGISTARVQSPPLLVMPVFYAGGVAQTFESRSPWQRAWAVFRTSDSTVDYVRTAGTGADTLLLQPGQMTRRNRAWWRVVLNQYGGADVVIPVARLERSYPGGPVRGIFSARYGPDNRLLGSFEMTGPSDRAIPDMMAKAVLKIDQMYQQALGDGRLRADNSLIFEDPDVERAKAERAAEIEARNRAEEAADATDRAAKVDAGAATPAEDKDNVASFSIQIDTPSSTSVPTAESMVRSIGGVKSANASSIAVGGTSVIAVRFGGDAATLKAGLEARGWKVQQSGNSFRIVR